MSDTSCLSSSCASYTSGPIGQLFTTSLQFLFAAQCMVNENWPPDSSHNLQDLIFDYIVVGAGSAGCVVASRLSEDSYRRVLLVEAGGDPPLESLVPSGAFSMTPSIWTWNYTSENNLRICQTLPDGKCMLPAGKMLGGDGSLNGMVYSRGNRKDYDDLEKAGNTGWNYNTALKYFKKSENLSDSLIMNDPKLSIYHRNTGLLGIRRSVLLDIDKVLFKGYSEAGYQYNPDPNGQYQIGTYRVFKSIQDGVRESTARAYLVPANGRLNLYVLKNALVTKILIRNKVATGVLIQLQNGTVIEATANKEVIVSAGVFRSPQLLMLSGIGPRAHLEKFNIPVIKDLPVGKNLITHTTVVFILNAPSSTPRNPTVKDVAEYLAFRKGYFSDIHYNGGAFITTNTPKERYIPNFHILQIIADQQIAFTITHLDVLSRGDVTLANADPSNDPKIKLNILGDDRDIEGWMKAFDFFVQLMDTKSFKSLNATYGPEPECGCFDKSNKDYWKCVLFRNILPSLHFRGTNKMGPPSDTDAVVNPQLQVYGIEHLRVVDGSVIPGTIRGHPNGAIIMFAERASDLIKETHECDPC